MKIKTKKQIAEAYCDDYCGKHHNYEDCKDRICFKMYLSFAYLEWFNSF